MQVRSDKTPKPTKTKTEVHTHTCILKMGLHQSRPLKEWGCEDVAAAISGLGQHYGPYVTAIQENSVDGALLLSLSVPEIRETLDDLKILNRLHRRVIEKKLLGLMKEGGLTAAATASSSVPAQLEPQEHYSYSSAAPKRYLFPKESGSCSSTDSRDEETSRTESESDPELLLTPEEIARKRIMDFMAVAQEQQRKEREALVARESALTSQIQMLRIQPRTE